MTIDNFKIRRGLLAELFTDGDVNNGVAEGVKLEEGCLYLCTDTADLFLGVKTKDQLTQEDIISLKRINGNNAANRPTTEPDAGDGEQIVEVIGAYFGENNELKLVLSDDTEKSVNELLGLTFATTESVYKKTERVRYEVLPVENLVVNYSDTEIRINTSNVIPYFQNSDKFDAEPNGFYIGLRAYAPSTAAYFKEDLTDAPGIQDERIFEFENNKYAGVDNLGRKYSVVWLLAARYNPETKTWTKYGDSATADKALGYYYTVEWYDENNTIIEANCIRVVFTNNDCHYSLVEDAVARRITEKLNGYAKTEELPTDYLTKDDLADKDFATNTALAGKAEAVHAHNISDITGVDFDEFAKKSEIPDVSDFISEIPDKYITNTELASELEDYAKTEALGELGGYDTVTAFVQKAFEEITDDITDDITVQALSGYATDEELTTAVDKITLEKANSVPFTTNTVVSKEVGGFEGNEDIKDWSVARILAKLLGIPWGETVYEDDISVELQELIESIKSNQTPIYQVAVDEGGSFKELEQISYTYNEYTHSRLGKYSGFYQIKNDSGAIKESGYEHYTINKNTIYMIALPETLVLGENVELYTWNGSDWQVPDLLPTSNINEIADVLRIGKDKLIIDDGYTIWAYTNSNDAGLSLRFVIKDVKKED
jgi:hypothetical protein